MPSQLDKIFDEDYPFDRDSVTYKELENRVKYRGVYVTANGLVFRKTGEQIKPKYVMKNYEDGSRKINAMNIDYSYNGKKEYRSYSRFVYAAWNPDFDIDDQSMVVVSTTGNKFEIHPKKLELIPRSEMLARVKEQNRIFNEEERKIIAEKWEEAKGRMSMEKFAEIMGVAPNTIGNIYREQKKNG